MLSFVRRERRPEYVQADHGLIIHQGEVGARPTGQRRATRCMGLRAGALAGLSAAWCCPRSRRTTSGRHAPALPVPWPAEAREALLEMLSGGPELVPGLGGAGSGGLHRPLDPLLGTDPGPAAAQPDPPLTPSTGTRCRRVVEVQRHLTRVERPDLLLLAACSTTSASCRAPAASTPRSARRSPGRPCVAIGLSER